MAVGNPIDFANDDLAGDTRSGAALSDRRRTNESLWAGVAALYPLLRRAANAYEANPAIQEELLQEILLTAWQSLSRLDDPRQLKSFVLRIAHNMGASHVRRELRRPRTLSMDGVLPAGALAEQRARDSDDFRALAEALRLLPLGLRQVMLLQLEGFSYDEISVTLGITSDNVGVRAHRARKRLAEILETDNVNESTGAMT